ncbi:uncharacterized protein BDCG_16404 [Blastomyces dermatitidis ER-3]|uniref:Uncharacterized protein n=1 Tax=Ajellomyces dermatitidis (strain ER-3 / ATCC MYA-2586) TaxID=559297 RepID=A0ABX2VRW9_AJEDR|nr:uncharacterized protein BDCG_16404 [Blastomyces dermatitidis ER-3]OAS99973.1 hypothetical protein BDCG_16404 [Blastomyces dermatitidis ER-3]
MKSFTVGITAHNHVFTLLSSATASDLQISGQPPVFLRPVSGFKQCSSSLCLSSAVLQAYNHLSSVHTISDQAYVNMPRFSINDSHAAAHFHNLIANER